MNPVMHLKSKLMTLSRKALVVGAAGVLAGGALAAVGVTAYVRNAPLLVTATDLANSLIGRTSTLLSPQGVPVQIAQAVAPVAPEAAAPAVPETAAPAPGAEPVTPVAALPEDAPVRTALTAAPEPVAPPTVTPGAESPPAFIPTAATTRPGAMPRQSQVRPAAVRRLAREICK